MLQQSLLGRKWSRRACSLALAMIVAPTGSSLAASPPPSHASPVQSSAAAFEDIAPFMGLRFAALIDLDEAKEIGGTSQSTPWFEASNEPTRSDEAKDQSDASDNSSWSFTSGMRSEPERLSETRPEAPVEKRQTVDWRRAVTNMQRFKEIPVNTQLDVSAEASKSPLDRFESGWVDEEPLVMVDESPSGNSSPSEQMAFNGPSPNRKSATDAQATNGDRFHVPSIVGSVSSQGEKRRDARRQSANDRALRKTSQRQPAPDPTVLPIGVNSPTQVKATIHKSIAGQAREYIEDGIALAERGAVYSARAQFVKVLRLVSQALDVELETDRHSTSLAAGLRALEEAKHFRPSGSRLEGNIRLDRILMTHRTPVLRDRSLKQISAIEAEQEYHAYAEQQLAIAGGRELVAADALFGLAKLQPHLDLSNDKMQVGPTAMSYYQSALMIYPRHFLAANELGVMFARFGQLHDAREVLRFGATAAPSFPDIWLNLAHVHKRLGETELADLAMGEYEALGVNHPSAVAARVDVEWLEPAEFSQRSGQERPQPDVQPREASLPKKAQPERRSQDGWPFR